MMPSLFVYRTITLVDPYDLSEVRVQVAGIIRDMQFEVSPGSEVGKSRRHVLLKFGFPYNIDERLPKSLEELIRKNMSLVYMRDVSVACGIVKQDGRRMLYVEINGNVGEVKIGGQTAQKIVFYDSFIFARREDADYARRLIEKVMLDYAHGSVKI